jgi:hypothetical protein
MSKNYCQLKKDRGRCPYNNKCCLKELSTDNLDKQQLLELMRKNCTEHNNKCCAGCLQLTSDITRIDNFGKAHRRVYY